MIVAIKLFHVLFVFIWMGTLLTLTRLMGYHYKQAEPAQVALGKFYRRIYFLVDLPAMIIALSTGIALLYVKEINLLAGWLHMKLTFTTLLVVCDILTGRYAFRIAKQPILKTGIEFKILHAATAIFLIGVLVSIYVLKVNGV